MFSVLGTEGSSELIFIPIGLVFVGSLIVFATSAGIGALIWVAAILLGGSVDGDSGDSGGSGTI